MQPVPQSGPPQGGPPPALLAMLAAHGAGGAPGAPAGPPPQQQEDDEHEPIRILQQMIQLGQTYQRVEPDAEDKATMAKVLATLHAYLAKDQQDAEAALGGGGATRVLRKLG